MKMLKKARKLEIRYPRQMQLSPEQKKLARRMALPMLAVPVLILTAILLVAYLVSRFI